MVEQRKLFCVLSTGNIVSNLNKLTTSHTASRELIVIDIMRLVVNEFLECFKAAPFIGDIKRLKYMGKRSIPAADT